MLHLQRTETAHNPVALGDLFDAFVQAGAPLHRSLSFGVFDASGTVVDRLLARLPAPAAAVEPDRTTRPSRASP